MERSKLGDRDSYIDRKLGDARVTESVADQCLLSALTEVGEARELKSAKTYIQVVEKDLESFRNRGETASDPVPSDLYDIHVKGLERIREDLEKYVKLLQDFEYNVEVLSGSISDLLYKLDYQRLSTGRPGEERKSLSF
ncbi:MAG: hypothetical protein LUC17_00105 [Oscillospiraceae bacterium]|nr:hypothetical protein [Oscillospiraceae bacterium]